MSTKGCWHKAPPPSLSVLCPLKNVGTRPPPPRSHAPSAGGSGDISSAISDLVGLQVGVTISFEVGQGSRPTWSAQNRRSRIFTPVTGGSTGSIRVTPPPPPYIVTPACAARGKVISCGVHKSTLFWNQSFISHFQRSILTQIGF